MIKEVVLNEIDNLYAFIERVWKKYIDNWPGEYHKVRHHHHRHRPREFQNVRQVLVTIFNNNKYSLMDPLSLEVGQKYPVVVGLVDADTGTAVSGTHGTPVVTSDTPDAGDVDADGNFAAKAIGTGKVTIVTPWTYTDSSTKQLVTTPETTVIDFGVVAPVVAENVKQVVSFGDAIHVDVPATT